MSAEIGEALKVDLALGAYRSGIITFGNHLLRSGAWSPSYVELRDIPSICENPDITDMTRQEQFEFRDRVVDTYGVLLDPLEYDHIQSIPEATDHLVGMIGQAHGDSVLKRRINLKKYGLSKAILGSYNDGDTTVLVDDVISSSGAKVDERNLVLDLSRPRAGVGDDPVGEPRLQIKDAVILVDRETGGIEAAAEAGLTVHAAIRLSEIMGIARAEGVMDPRVDEIIQGYRDGSITKASDIHPRWEELGNVGPAGLARFFDSLRTD